MMGQQLADAIFRQHGTSPQVEVEHAPGGDLHWSGQHHAGLQIDAGDMALP